MKTFSRSGLPLALAALLLAVAPPADAAPSGCELDFMLVFDTSGSMAEEDRLTAAQDGAKLFLATLDDPKDRSGLVEYNTGARLEKVLDSDHDATRRAVEGLVAEGHTAMGAGIRAAHDEITRHGRSGVRQIMVVLADGASTDDPMPAARDAKTAGIELFTIAIHAADHAQMDAVASDPDHTYAHNATTSAEVVAAFESILQLVHPLCADFSAVAACAGEPVLFTESSMLIAPVTIERGTWDFGDGTTLSVDPWTATARHAFTSWGDHTVTLNLTDSRGQVDEVAKDVHVPACPSADFTCTASTDPWLRTAFEDRSNDADGTIVARSWDLAGLGHATGPSPVFDFPAAGRYDVTLTVTDDEGRQAERTRSCEAREDLPPVFSPLPAYLVPVGSTLGFQVHAVDPEGAPLVHGWRPGDLPEEAYDAATRAFSWTPGPQDEGLHQATFEARDATHTATLVVAIGVTGPDSDLDGDGQTDALDACPLGICMDLERIDALEAAVVMAAEGDGDGDDVPDGEDNCPTVPNRAQDDLDGDGRGDLCDPDIDGDEIANLDGRGRLLDNCPYTPNDGQEDADGDGIGDACAGDVDADAVADAEDNCPWVPNPGQEDADEDGQGDACQVLEGLDGLVIPGYASPPAAATGPSGLAAVEQAAWPWLAMGAAAVILGMVGGTVSWHRRG